MGLISKVLISMCLVVPSLSYAQTAQETFDRNMANTNEVSARQAHEADVARMRDASHDNRLMINKDTSVGIGSGGANVRTTRGQ
jgi:hypothetical protein